MGLGCSKDDAGEITCSEKKLNSLFRQFEEKDAQMTKAQDALIEGLERVAPVNEGDVDLLLDEVSDYVKLKQKNDNDELASLQRRLDRLGEGNKKTKRKRHNKRKRVIKSRKKKKKNTRGKRKRKKRGTRRR
jgi:hypothetical protein